MTTLQTTDDLLRAARENLEFREAFRREILTDDLINLPQRFETYASETTRNITALTSNVAELTQNVAEMSRNIDAIRISHRAEHNALHLFRCNYAVDAARNNRINIARLVADVLGISRFRLRILTQEERDDLLDDNFEAIDQLAIEDNVSDTFPTGDIIAEISHRRSRDTIFYIAVEASYTVDADDVIRASDHAKILRGATGHEAFAIVSGVDVNPAIRNTYGQRIIYDLNEYVDSEQDDVVFWFQLADRNLEPLPPC